MSLSTGNRRASETPDCDGAMTSPTVMNQCRRRPARSEYSANAHKLEAHILLRAYRVPEDSQPRDSLGPGAGRYALEIENSATCGSGILRAEGQSTELCIALVAEHDSHSVARWTATRRSPF